MTQLNQNRPGYKHTPLGWIPEDWEIRKMKEIAKVQGGYAFDSKKFATSGRYQVVKMSNVYNGVLDLNRSASFLSSLSVQEQNFMLRHDDILLTLTGTIGKRDYGYTYRINGEENLVLNQRVARIISIREKANPVYLSYALKTKRILDQFFFSARGGTGNQANVGTGDVELIDVIAPPLSEQQKISDILLAWDEAIIKIQQFISQLQERNGGFSQQLLVRKKRLNGFEDEWKKLRIHDIAKEIVLKNRGGKDLTVLSCTKYDGLVPSLEYFGRQVFGSDTSTYKIVPLDHFAYATNHIEEGSIGYQSRFEEALISPMYTVFKTNSEVYDDYLLKLLKSHQFIHEYRRRMEGSIDRRGGLRWDEFSKIIIDLPELEEQKAIASLLNKAEEEVKCFEKNLDPARL